MPLEQLVSDNISTIKGEVFRLVENQEQIATRSYVDTLEEQDILEQILEQSKPRYHVDTPEGMHYLLKSPFRYPPLHYGSRFGRTVEFGIFYGALTAKTVLAEVAFYRCVYWHSPEEPFPNPLISQHTLFSALFESQQGIDLRKAAFNEYHRDLQSPTEYRSSQQLGSVMRDYAHMFLYASARDPDQGGCVGIFTPKVFINTKPNIHGTYHCETDGKIVSFREAGSFDRLQFRVEQFFVNGKLPQPA
ncbi:RES family NAD+ phosphorylase [Oceaniserpentilla sp. 4NH20-0058]|uniref:RES family NAD+ phosphorylase n=1 Tax=Oceaniserpentilla sp. 4NH20-0058 TaxID=3127660 RepID=UPI0031031E07